MIIGAPMLVKGYSLEPYQVRGIISGNSEGKSIYSLLKEGKKNILAVSPGGSGKTTMISKIAFDYISNTTKDVAIFVHRKELLDHARIEMNDWYGIYSQRINADTKFINDGMRVFCCMIETFDRRSDDFNFIKYFDNVGLYMIDEAHLAHFAKVFKHFPNAIRIGWTATPIAANKKEPLKLIYDDMVVIASIPELIELNKNKPSRGIVSCENNDFCIDIDVDFKNLKKGSNGDWSEKSVGDAFGKKEQIRNAILAYEKHSKNQKCIIFNGNIEHSLKMHNEMIISGYNSQHIDSDNKSKFSSKAHRKFIFGDNNDGWLHKDKTAILNNVGIATIGTDCKSIRWVFINKRTTSFTLFWQMVFRANRACIFEDGSIKESFGLVDLGNNMLLSGEGHGIYYDPANFDWEYMFHNPFKPRPKEGIAPIKNCPECGAICSAQARICLAKTINQLDDEESECGFIFPFANEEKEEDTTFREMIRVSDIIKSKVDVQRNITFFTEQGRKEGFIVYETIKQVVNVFDLNFDKDRFMSIGEVGGFELPINEFQVLLTETYSKVCQLFKIWNERKWNNLKKTVEEDVRKRLNDFGYTVLSENGELSEEEINQMHHIKNL